MNGPQDTRGFRQRLDDVLRQRNPTALRDFLIAEGQWDEDHVPADLDRAMWMMIAASAALRDQHDEAERWLIAHGFAGEAQAILGRGSGPRARGTGPSGGGATRRPSSPRGGKPPHAAGQRRQSGPSGGNSGGKPGGKAAHSPHQPRYPDGRRGGANSADGAQPGRRPRGEGG